MRITSIFAYRVELHLVEGTYAWANGKHVDIYDSTIVRIDTDGGITGYGEVCCPVAPGYTPSFPEGVRAGMAKVIPQLLGEDPTKLSRINHIMDATLTGHFYAKSGIDIACWDILGRAAGLPICTLLGGQYGKDFPLYHPVTQEAPADMARRVSAYRAHGYQSFQLKVGGDPDTDIERIRAVAAEMKPGEKLIADANRGWLTHEAMRVIKALDDVKVYIEQPCSTYEECLSVRRKCRHPFVLDESIETICDIIRARCDDAADIINIKIGKMGGLTKASKARDICVELGFPVCIDNTKGSDIMTAVMAHLAHSTPPDFLFMTTDFNSYMVEQVAEGAPKKHNGRMSASKAPGLGIAPLIDRLGTPALEFLL